MPVNLSAASTTQWQFLPWHLELTPSLAEGVSFESEFTTRRTAINKMIEIFSNLHLEDYTKEPTFALKSRPGGGRGINGEALMGRTETEHEHYLAVGKEFQSISKAKDVLTTAATFLHRFYMRHSLSSYAYQEIAATCVYIALKVEDRLNVKALNVGRISKRAFGDSSPSATAKWESIIIAHEETVLEALCYDLTLEQPLGALLTGFEKMRPWMKAFLEERKRGEKREAEAKADTEGGGGLAAAKVEEGLTGTRKEVGRETEVKLVESRVGRGASSMRTAKGKLKEAHLPHDLLESVVLELAYVICCETITAPLCLVALPNHIAASALLLALSMIHKVIPGTLLAKVDMAWVRAFCEGYFEAGETGGVDGLQVKLKDAMAAILLYRDKKFMAGILDPDWILEHLEEVNPPVKIHPVATAEILPSGIGARNGATDEPVKMEVDEPLVTKIGKTTEAGQPVAMKVEPPSTQTSVPRCVPEGDGAESLGKEVVSDSNLTDPGPPEAVTSAGPSIDSGAGDIPALAREAVLTAVADGQQDEPMESY